MQLILKNCFFAGLLVAVFLSGCGLRWSAVGQVVRPPNYSPDAIPETGFTCEDKITGGYYADPEAACQLFHVCVQVSEYEVGQQQAFFYFYFYMLFYFICFILFFNGFVIPCTFSTHTTCYPLN